ncbi:hypothetical protein D3C81_1753250 [compost metagenome]
MLVQIPAQIRSPGHILAFGRAGRISSNTVAHAVDRAAAAKSNLSLLYSLRKLLGNICAIFIQQAILCPIQQQLTFDCIRVVVLVIPEDDDVAQITGSHHCGDFGIPAGQV